MLAWRQQHFTSLSEQLKKRRQLIDESTHGLGRVLNAATGSITVRAAPLDNELGNFRDLDNPLE